MRRLDIPIVCAFALTLSACGDVPQSITTSPTTASRSLACGGSGHLSDTTAVIYTNFGQGRLLDGWVLPFAIPGFPGPLAFSERFFAPPGDYQFVSATVALQNGGTDPRTPVFLQADSMGRPGRIVEAMVLESNSAADSLYVARSLNTPVLTDSLYWLTVAPRTTSEVGGWFMNDTGDRSVASFAWTLSGDPAGPWSLIGGPTRGALRIEGRAIGSRGGVMHQASGGGTVLWETPEGEHAKVTWSVSAQSMINGTTTGQFLALGHDGHLLFKGAVSCLVVVGNRAFLTVDITQAPSWAFDPMPARFALGLEDNGEGGKATAPDRISLLRVLYEDDPTCQRVAPSLDWTNGNAQVR